MTELKTLKDLNKFYRDSCYEHVRTDELKAEAVKYLKDLEEAKSKTHETERYEISDGEMAFQIMEKTQNWIKHFFNLTEEDLK